MQLGRLTLLVDWIRAGRRAYVSIVTRKGQQGCASALETPPLTSGLVSDPTAGFQVHPR